MKISSQLHNPRQREHLWQYHRQKDYYRMHQHVCFFINLANFFFFFG